MEGFKIDPLYAGADGVAAVGAAGAVSGGNAPQSTESTMNPKANDVATENKMVDFQPAFQGDSQYAQLLQGFEASLREGKGSNVNELLRDVTQSFEKLVEKEPEEEQASIRQTFMDEVRMIMEMVHQEGMAAGAQSHAGGQMQ